MALFIDSIKKTLIRPKLFKILRLRQFGSTRQKSPKASRGVGGRISIILTGPPEDDTVALLPELGPDEHEMLDAGSTCLWIGLHGHPYLVPPPDTDATPESKTKGPPTEQDFNNAGGPWDFGPSEWKVDQQNKRQHLGTNSAKTTKGVDSGAVHHGTTADGK
ncbi:MAG: hypothetical protein M4579_001025 [Chaenotheca gracillima]|nr:MAG: hypothetical protein M4579_001025 [Chaenotheca gracillima]